ncbi:MAG: SMC-Scp complex subunit ScpB [Kiritimatiellae bacterium]|nr:SMC-Scp complex subunit ScpB [Kiritimatiellia bacterium]
MSTLFPTDPPSAPDAASPAAAPQPPRGLPALSELVGAMLFVRKEPLTLAELRRVLKEAAKAYGGETEAFASADDDTLRAAVSDVARALEHASVGFRVREIAGGWQLENDVACGPWLRILLGRSRGTRLSIPALETLAVIAYRQPCIRADIEAVRGVAVDAVLKNLLELDLVRVAGRSDLPGRPWLFATATKFMEHFGLKSLRDLPGTDELRRMEAAQKKARAAAPAAATADAPATNQLTISGIDPAPVSPAEAVGPSGDLFPPGAVPPESAEEPIPEEEE